MLFRSDTDFRQLREPACAVADLLGRHAEQAEQRELQVRQRGVFGIHDMTATLERTTAAAHYQCGKRAVRVTVAVTDARAVQKDHVVEQRAIAVRLFRSFSR